MNSIISIIISTVTKSVYVWLKGKFDVIIKNRRGKEILENFKATVWKTE